MSKKIEVTGCAGCKFNDGGHWCSVGIFSLDRSLTLGVHPDDGDDCPLEDGPITIELKVRDRT